MSEIRRHLLGDYLSPASGTAAYALMGLGVVQLDENANPKIDKTAFINNEKTPSASVVGYEPEFPFDAQMRSGETATMSLVSVGEDRKTGADAEFYYVRVNLYETATEGAYPARRIKVCAKVDSITGAGLEIVRVKGSFIEIECVSGTFNPTTKAFVAA